VVKIVDLRPARVQLPLVPMSHWQRREGHAAKIAPVRPYKSYLGTSVPI